MTKFNSLKLFTICLYILKVVKGSGKYALFSIIGGII